MASDSGASADQETSATAARWPQELTPVFERFKTTEFTSLTASGQPITTPLTPYTGDDGASVDVTTGLTYPAKADRVRRNPRVSLYFSNPTGSGLTRPPTILVLGSARVVSADLQANTDRYIRLSFAKNPEANKSMSAGLIRRLDWYFVRLWIATTPQEIFWWPEGDLDATPHHWRAPENLALPPSDPPPTGANPRGWAKRPDDWQSAAKQATRQMGLPVLTLVNESGYPVSARARSIELTKEGFALELPAGAVLGGSGRASLTFHSHPDQFVQQQNLTFVGEASVDERAVRFTVARRLADWSLRPGLLGAWDFLGKGRILGKRLAAEAARYGQPVPVVRLPEPVKPS